MKFRQMQIWEWGITGWRRIRSPLTPEGGIERALHFQSTVIGHPSIATMLSNKITDFLFNLDFPVELPPGIEVMHPFLDAETARIVEVFYNKYYGDDNPRYCIIGINPGRFGGGVTGIPFTDPIRLEKEC